MEILFLTKSLDFEYSFLNVLHQINCEALLSSRILDKWEETGNFPEWVQNFDAIILSETIPLSEIKELIYVINKNGQFCLLKSSSELPKVQREFFNSAGSVYAYIYTDIYKYELSDILKNIKKKKELDLSSQLSTSKKKSIESFKKKLSYINKNIMDILEKQKEHFISRRELSNLIWGTCTESTLSQLSLRVKQINKIAKLNIEVAPTIVTQWGKGYKISKEFFEYMSIQNGDKHSN